MSGPGTDIRRVDCYALSRAVDAPVVTAFGTYHDRPVVLLRVEDRDGAFGRAEVRRNFPNLGAEHRARLLETLVAHRTVDRSFESPESAFAALAAESRVRTLRSGEPGAVAQCVAGIDIA